MSLAVIDAREWQNLFDLETGKKRNTDTPAVRMVRQVLNSNPYPGDTDAQANAWVTRTALDLIEKYQPGLVCLSYVQQYFECRHFEYSRAQQGDMFAKAMDEALSFIDRSGYTPVIVGTGGLVPLKGDIDLSGLDGLALCSNWSARYCGLHYPGKTDLQRIESMEGIERIIPKDQWIDLFKQAQPDLDMPEQMELMPQFLIVSEQGWSFKAMGTTLRKPVCVPGHAFEVPVCTSLGRVDDLRQIKDLVLSGLEHEKIALILVEGLDMSYFPSNSFSCTNGAGWFCYEPGDAFYLTLTTGKHQPFAYPAGYRFFDREAEQVRFPFSGYMTSLPEQTVGRDFTGKSITVGNRSMYMHMVFGTDISIECFARNLFNQGCMGVIHNQNKRTQ